MKNNIIRIATRCSPLAIWQAEFVKQQLLSAHPHLCIDLIKISTKGDENSEQPLAEIGGKSLFVKALQQALLDREADLAVHSIKDMSVHDYPELTLGAILKRSNASDVFISNTTKTIDQLSPQAIIGTASPRRQALIAAHYPLLTIKLLRGNVNTRLKKLDDGEYDGIILAAAGLERLGLAHRIQTYLPNAVFIPAIGQGALGIECRSQDNALLQLISSLHDESTAYCVNAERVVNQQIGGDCFSAIGAHATIDQGLLHLTAFVADTEGRVLLYAKNQGIVATAKAIGLNVANDLIQQGALALLHK